MKKNRILAFLILYLVSSPVFSQRNGEEKVLRLENRKVEFGLEAKAGFGNDFLTAPEFFRETVVIDLDNFKNGLRMDAGLDVTPFFFNYNHNDKWGLGFFFRVEAAGNMAFPGKMLTLAHAEREKADIGAAVFADIGLKSFFHINKMKITLSPSRFFPVIYSEPDISYTFIGKPAADGTETTEMNVSYDVKLFSAFNIESFNGITADVGLDFGLGLEYPLFSVLDLGMDLIHVPLVPAILRNYMQIKGSAEIGDSVDIVNMDMDSLFSFNNDDIVYGLGRKVIIRPMKMLFFADYHPGKLRLFSLIPSAGLAYNPLFRQQPFSPEGGIRLKLDLINIFITTIGIHYEDRLWKNSAGLSLNFRVFQVDIGLAVQSQDFVKSWQAGGLGASVGLKFGL
jgi:hypothetical protein